MSIPASFIDPKIVDLNNLNYDAWSVIAYQRTTVILTELVLGVVLLKWVDSSPAYIRHYYPCFQVYPGFH